MCLDAPTRVAGAPAACRSKNTSRANRPSSSNSTYDSSKITVLRGLEAVRKRPGMYIGDVHDGTGLHHMVFEVVDNSIDEALAGHATEVNVTLHEDGSVSVSDNGRGIPVDIHKEEGISAAEVILTVLHAGGKFDDNSYKVSGGLHGVGVSWSTRCPSTCGSTSGATASTTGRSTRSGEPSYPLQTLEPSERRGTLLRFKPAAAIFTDVEFHYDILAKRLRELSFLNSGVASPHRRARAWRRQRCPSRRLPVRRRHPLLRRTPGATEDAAAPERDLGVGRNERHHRRRRAAVDRRLPGNDVLLHQQHPAEGWRHPPDRLPRRAHAHAVQLHRTERHRQSRPRVALSGDDMREGMIAGLSVKVPDPSFSSQTKEKLVSSDVRRS
jgi:DNA gyrase subunit B